MSWHWMKRALLMKQPHMYWQENIRTKDPLLFYIGDIQRNTYFNPCGHRRGCGKIGRAETFGDFGPYRYELRSSTGVAFKIWRGHKKTL